MSLTAKQSRFVAEYLIDLNGTQAAVRAGYSPKTANEQAARLLANVSVQSALQAAMTRREIRTEITQDKVLRELAKIGFSDIRKAVKWGDSVAVLNEDSGEMVMTHGLALLASDAIDDETASAIAEVSESKQGLKVKFHDKRAALVDIGKHLGMFTDKVELTGKNGGPIATKAERDLTDEELAAELASYGLKP